MVDHVHIAAGRYQPKYSTVAHVGGLTSRARSAINVKPGTTEKRKRNFVGQSFWARGYFVSTGWAGRGRDP
jgi:putative transposase